MWHNESGNRMSDFVPAVQYRSHRTSYGRMDTALQYGEQVQDRIQRER